MALTITYRGSVYSTTAASSYTAGTSWTPAANSLLVALVVGCSTTVADPTSVSGHGGSYTKLTLSANGISTTHALSVWVRDAGASPTNAAAAASWGSSRTGGAVIEFEVTGAAIAGGATGCIVQNPTNNGTGTSGSVTLSAAGNSQNRPMSFWCHLANEATTPRTNWTETTGADGNFNNPATGAEGQFRSDTFETTASASWTTSSAWRGVALEIKAQLVYTATVTGGATAGAGSVTYSFVAAPLDKQYTGSGGAVADGTATKARTFAYPVSGGAVASGVATTSFSRSWSYTGADGAVASGAATTSYTQGSAAFSYTGSGGAVATGAASLARTWAPVSTGGATASGTATRSRTWSAPSAGGAVASGAATTSLAAPQVYSYSGTGGGVAAGTAAHSRTWSTVISGGAVASGSATTSLGSAQVYSYTATGGAEARGLALKSWTRVYGITGGVVVRGFALCYRTYARLFAGSGGAVADGTATSGLSRQRVYATSGGAVAGGGGAWARTITARAGGGVYAGGEASSSCLLLLHERYEAFGGGTIRGAADCRFYPLPKHPPVKRQMWARSGGEWIRLT